MFSGLRKSMNEYSGLSGAGRSDRRAKAMCEGINIESWIDDIQQIVEQEGIEQVALALNAICLQKAKDIQDVWESDTSASTWVALAERFADIYYAVA